VSSRDGHAGHPDRAYVEHNYDALVRIEADGEAPFLVGGKAQTLKRHFVEDVRAADLRERIRTCAERYS
jgi:hypothetical protein